MSDKPENFKGIKDNYGVTKKDISRGFTPGMAEGETRGVDDIPMLYDSMAGEELGGFLGRGKGWER